MMFQVSMLLIKLLHVLTF